MPLRLLIVEDDIAMRTAVRMRLRTDPEFDVVGEAEDGESAVQLAAELKPDAILMDIHLPGIDGIEATRQILGNPAPLSERGQPIRVVTLSSADEAKLGEMRAAGAIGQISKFATADLLSDLHVALEM